MLTGVLYKTAANTKIKIGDKMRQTRFPRTGDCISWYSNAGELYCSTVVNGTPNLLHSSTPFRDISARPNWDSPLGVATTVASEAIVVNTPNLGGLHVLFLRAGDAEILG
jgi:hypothetical protein